MRRRSIIPFAAIGDGARKCIRTREANMSQKTINDLIDLLHELFDAGVDAAEITDAVEMVIRERDDGS